MGVNPDTIYAGTSCCGGCTNKETGWMTKNFISCENATTTWPKMFTDNCVHKQSWYKPTKYCQLACWQGGSGYAGDNCSAGAYVEQRVCGHLGERVRHSVAAANCA